MGVRDDEQNPAATAWPGPVVILVSIILSSLCIACYCINFFKFYHHLRYTNGITTAKVFFTIDILANFMRLWYVCINPFYLSKLNYTWTTMCSTTHVGLSCVCCLLLALKWRELLRRQKLQVTVFLTTYKYPFFIMGTFIFLFELVASAFRGHWYSLTPLTLTSISFMMIIASATSSLLIASGIQIILHLRKAVGSRGRIARLCWTTTTILLSGVFLLIWALINLYSILGLYTHRGITVTTLNVNSSLSFACLLISSLLQNWSMPIPGIYDSSTFAGSHQTDSELTGRTENATMSPRSPRTPSTAPTNNEKTSSSSSEDEKPKTPPNSP